MPSNRRVPKDTVAARGGRGIRGRRFGALLIIGLPGACAPAGAADRPPGQPCGGVVVAYEADAIDPETHLGWSVVVTRYARLVTDRAELARPRELLHPWAPPDDTDQAVRIRPGLVTGVRLAGEDG
ncbi:pyridoxamine 5'-phosphate oxidase family protein [Streptomyces sp. CRPSP2-6A1]|nr:pyridoxamine 5'-phosphate oxidase family protein [Streptomyces sp. CRPSP2-6A1]